MITRRQLCSVALLCPAWCRAQTFSDIKVERVAAGLKFAEGPVWTPDHELVFSDTPTSRLLRIGGGEPMAVVREQANGPVGNAIDPQGRLYTCEQHTRRVIRTDKKGKMEVLAERWEGKRLNAPNDIAVRHDGHAYFTDPAFGKNSGTRELDFYGIYHITPKGVVELVAKPAGRPNGVALSPGGKHLYVTNSDDKSIRAYDLDRSGVASNERVLVKTVPGVPDGLRTDEKGNLYVACKGLAVYSAEGKQVFFIDMPETPSNLAFGDNDMQTLFITARTSVYRIRLDVKGATA